jgi:hypothetical protein
LLEKRDESCMEGGTIDQDIGSGCGKKGLTIRGFPESLHKDALLRVSWSENDL